MADTSFSPRFLMFSFLALTKSKSFPYSSLWERAQLGWGCWGALVGTARLPHSPHPPLDAAEGVLGALLGLDLKVKGAGGGGAAGEVDEGDLIEADVHGGLVHVDEAPLQRVQQP